VQERLNPDFAVEIVMRVSNAIQIGISRYFLNEEIVNYLEVKKCSERLSCEALGRRKMEPILAGMAFTRYGRQSNPI